MVKENRKRVGKDGKERKYEKRIKWKPSSMNGEGEEVWKEGMGMGKKKMRNKDISYTETNSL